MSTLTAARWQMTLSLAFHMVFAAIGIGLPLLLVIVEGLYLRTRQEHYLRLAKKWAKATGLLFAVGAVSGTALAFELGLLWPKYMAITGAVVGHIFGLEGFAFFIEAICIGLYLYGWDRLSPRGHWWCGVIIAVSGALSGILVLGVNSWMQLPVGFTLTEGGKVVVTDPIAIFKRYGWVVMAIHSTLACYMAVAFAVAGVYAWGWLKGERDTYHTSAIRIAMAIAIAAAVLQPLSGDFLAKFVFRTQKAKFAAMEGQFVTQRRAPLRVGGWPDLKRNETRWALELPGGLSFLATHDAGAEVTGLDQIPRADWPNVHVTHLSFQIMIALGMMMIAISAAFWLTRWRKSVMWSLVVAGPMGFVALEAGWMVTEVGRQPWIINGIMRTADAVTPAAGVTGVFFGFTLLYLVLGTMVVLLLRGLSDAGPTATRAPQEIEPSEAVR